VSGLLSNGVLFMQRPSESGQVVVGLILSVVLSVVLTGKLKLFTNW